MRYTTERLGEILTREQLVKVEQILSCETGRNKRMDALKEYFRRPDVSSEIRESGWDPYTLAYLSALSFDSKNEISSHEG
tara:strand:+ start:3394 stop:3633 length:240 start_codon:yes stop_codon:yes gene_type:complete